MKKLLLLVLLSALSPFSVHATDCDYDRVEAQSQPDSARFRGCVVRAVSKVYNYTGIPSTDIKTEALAQEECRQLMAEQQAFARKALEKYGFPAEKYSYTYRLGVANPLPGKPVCALDATTDMPLQFFWASQVFSGKQAAARCEAKLWQVPVVTMASCTRLKARTYKLVYDWLRTE